MSSPATPSKLVILAKMAAGALLPTIPILVWYKTAVDDRQRHAHSVQTKFRVPNVQTVDDLMVEQCQPGDVVLFDRRCDKCAAGPVAALACLAAKSFLCCNENKNDMMRVVDPAGAFEHCGIVVPGTTATNNDKSKALDPSHLLLLEATASEGVVARPLLTRLEMSRSQTVLLLPLAAPNERRNVVNDDDNDHDVPEKTRRVQQYMHKQLVTFRDTWVEESQRQNYAAGHSTLGLLGAVSYALGLSSYYPAPTSPSAWLVVNALQQAGAAVHLRDGTAMETKVEDFLRDHRFHENETVRLRPGWKFLPPVAMRETSRS